MKKKSKISFLAFLIPFFLFITLFLCLRIGFKYTPFVSDMKAQYVSLFHAYQNFFKDPSSIFYSFSNGLGNGMFGTIAYYLASPLNFLILPFDVSNLDIAVILVLALKIGLAGFTMFYYLKNHFKKENGYLLIFSTCYALMIYNIAYFFHVMWLDGIILLPLVLLGIDRIIQRKSSCFYGIFLALSILTNYYIGYMICIFSCLYFLYQLVITYQKKDYEKIIASILSFGIASLLAGFMTMFVLIPTLLELQTTIKSSGFSIFSNITISFDYLKIVKSMINGEYGYTNILNSNNVLIYCGILPVYLTALYFLNKKITFKEKLASLIFIAFFFISFTFSPLNYIWHGFNEPSCFAFRFSFLFSFLILLLGCRSFLELKHITKEQSLIAFTIILVLDFACFYHNASIYNYIIIVLLSLYSIILYVLNHLEEDRVKDLKWILIFLVLGEIFFSSFITLRDFEFTEKKEYQDYVSIVGGSIDSIKDSSLYRIEKEMLFSETDSFLLDYDGISSFLSTLKKDVLTFSYNSGLRTYQNAYRYGGYSNAFLDSILNVKYYITEEEKEDYLKVDEFSYSRLSGLFYGSDYAQYKVYENPYALSRMFLVSEDVLDYVSYMKEHEYTNKAQYQMMIASTMAGEEIPLFEPVDILEQTEDFLKVKINNKEDLVLCIYYTMDSNVKLDIKVNGQTVHQLSSSDAYQIVIPNNFEIGDVVSINFVRDKDKVSLNPKKEVYTFNKEAFEKFYNSRKSLDVRKIKSNRYQTEVSLDYDQVLFTSIPYDSNWIVKVDSKRVEPKNLYGTFLGVSLDKGDHKIEFHYVPKGLLLGTIISFISMVGFAFFVRFEEKIIAFFLNIYLKFEEVINYLIVGVLTTAISVLSYMVFTYFFHISYLISNVLSWVLSVAFAYFANRTMVFASKNKDLKSMLMEVYQFLKYRLVSLGIDMALMYILVTILKLNDVLSKIFVQVVIIVLNYVFSKLFVFTKK